MRKKRGIFKRIGAGFLAVAVCLASSNAMPVHASEYETEYQYELETQGSENAPSEGEEQDGASQTVEKQDEAPESQKEEAAESQAEETDKASESASAEETKKDEASESQEQSSKPETETEETAGTEKATKTEETAETEKVTETESATETVTETESATETESETETETEEATETETEATETEQIEIQSMEANADGVLAYYDFDEMPTVEGKSVIQDKSGASGRDAEVKGSGAEIKGNALYLPGSNGTYVELPTGIMDGQEKFSFTLWMSPEMNDSTDNYAGVTFGRLTDDSQKPLYYLLLNPRNRNNNFKAAITDGNWQSLNKSGAWSCETAASKTPTYKTWGMYTVVVEEGSVKGYYNGNEVSNETKSIKISDFGNDLLGYIGKSFYSEDQYYKGYVDEMKIFSKALTADEVKAIYEEGRQKEEVDTNGGLLARYDFSDLEDGDLDADTEITNNSSDSHKADDETYKACIKGSGAKASGGALVLPGGSKDSGAYMQLPTGLLDGKENLTISAWMQNTTTPGNYAGLYYGSNEATPTKYVLLNPCVKDKDNDKKFKGVMTKTADNTAGYNKETKVSDTTTDSNWGLYTIVVRGTTIYGYYNGKRVSEDTTTAKFSDFGSGLVGYVGCSPYPDGLYSGQVDNVEIYDKALTAAEVKTLYDEGRQKEEEDTNGGLLARYDFSDMDGAIEAGKEIKNTSDDTNKASDSYKAVIRGNGAYVTRGALVLPGGSKDSGAYVELPKGLLNGKNNLTFSVRMQNTTKATDCTGIYYGTEETIKVNKWNNDYYGPSRYVLLYPAKRDKAEDEKGAFRCVMTKTNDLANQIGWMDDGEQEIKGGETDNTWGLYTLVVRGNEMKSYYNGKEVGSTYVENKFSELGDDLVGYVGCSPYPDPLYSGQVDDIEIYDKALTSEEVAALYEKYADNSGETPELPTADKKAVSVKLTDSEGNELKVTDGKLDDVVVTDSGKNPEIKAEISYDDNSKAQGIVSWETDFTTKKNGEYAGEKGTIIHTRLSKNVLIHIYIMIRMQKSIILLLHGLRMVIRIMAMTGFHSVWQIP